MKILRYTASPEINIFATAAEYHALAELVSAGHGTQNADPTATDTFGGIALVQIRVSTQLVGQVLITVDSTRTSLEITGDLRSLATLAANLDDMATNQQGGHLHIDYFPDHAYLAAGSAPIVVNSPHGGMPTT